MKFSAAAVLAIAAGASAHSNVTYTTEVVDVYTTYCPGPTAITHGGKTYTVTEATTLTITDCPCTVTKPVIPTSSVVCHGNNCSGGNGGNGGYSNGTVPTGGKNQPGKPTGGAGKTGGSNEPGKTGGANEPGKTGGNGSPAPTGELPAGSTPTGSAPGTVPTAGAGKVAAFSGAGLAGIIGLAAFAL